MSDIANRLLPECVQSIAKTVILSLVGSGNKEQQFFFCQKKMSDLALLFSIKNETLIFGDEMLQSLVKPIIRKLWESILPMHFRLDQPNSLTVRLSQILASTKSPSFRLNMSTAL